MRKLRAPRASVRRLLGFGAALASALAVAACGSSGGSTTTTTSHSGTGGASSAKHLKIAYLSFAVDNSYDAPMLAAAQAVAAADHATVTVFDAANDPATQYSQFQDAITSGGYNGIITQPIESTNLIPLVAKAVAKGIKVVNIDQILGANLDTSKVQVKGLSGNVTFVPLTMGEQLGKLAVQACKSKNLNPCDVGYLYDVKASALDVAIRDGFNKATAGTPVKVVAEGQDNFTPSQGLTAVENMMTADPHINVIAGSDQGLEGADQATSAKNAMLVGYGGSAAGIAGVKSGRWYGTIAQDPASEGRIGMQTLINAIRENKSFPGQNPLDSLPDQGVITKADVTKFTAEWPG